MRLLLDGVHSCDCQCVLDNYCLNNPVSFQQSKMLEVYSYPCLIIFSSLQEQNKKGQQILKIHLQGNSSYSVR